MKTATSIDYASRDHQAQVTFYVLLWKRPGLSRQLFDDYWRDVHGPVCARLPGQYQYWQFHLDAPDNSWQLPGSDNPIDPCDGIAELTFETVAQRQTWFEAAGILMADEHNVFRKAIGYNTDPNNSVTVVDRIATGDPNGASGLHKFHILVQQADGVSVEQFRHYLRHQFAPAIAASELVLKLRLHLLEAVDNSRPDAAGVVHTEPPAQQYQAAVEIAFAHPLAQQQFLATAEYAEAVAQQSQYVSCWQPLPERAAYTFVYGGQMTLAGQRSSTVAGLITQLGAANQLAADVVCLMSGKRQVKSDLSHYLQGVQHVGVTVHDMAKSLEFYIDVLGGKLAIAEDGLVGERMQNTLFQTEELEAIAQGIDPKSFDVPNLRAAQTALDVKFISFGNTCLELIYFRDAATPNAPKSSSKSIPSHVGNVNAMHISFHVKDDVDLNVFANMLETECQRRGLNNVVFNRVIQIKSEAERKQVALKYNSNKFWHQPDSTAEPQAAEFGEFEGWALFYCKGPNGEQLEFNQVTRKAKGHFARAQAEYNRTNGTYLNSTQEDAMSEAIIHATFSSPANATWETVWNVLLDKVENPGCYNPATEEYRILERHDNGVLREMKALNMTVKEKITWDENTREIRHLLVDNPLFTGQAVNAVRPNSNNEAPIITYTLDWEPYNETARNLVPEIQPQLEQAVKHSVLSTKTAAEQQDSQSTSLATTTNHNQPMLETLPGTNTDLVKRLFSRGEAFDAAGFVTFFTDTPVYQFGNFEICLDQAAIKQSAEAFFSRISAVYHEIKTMWEVGDVVFVEMDVTYWRKDGSVISLPCCDIFRVEGDKFSELRIFMDVNPVFDPTIPVSDTATVFAVSEGKRLTPPNTMKKHFAEHPEGKQRVATGYAPKWSIADPKWLINEEGGIMSEQLLAEQLQVASQVSTAVLAEDWETVKAFLTDDILYKVGSAEPVYGKQAVVDFLSSLFQTTAKFTGHEVRKIWNEPGIVAVEMDAKYTTVKDKKHLMIACCDIYRMRGNQLSEWRVYADILPFYETEELEEEQPTRGNGDGKKQVASVRSKK